MGKYARFVAMIGVSTLVMLALTYLNLEQPAHMHFSQTRLFMALIMGASMAIVMFAFMRHMYANRRANAALVLCSLGVFVLALWLVRSQATVGDAAYLKGMIPHHSIAILTSERAAIRDPRVRALADRIIDAQEKEIREMEALIADIERKGVQGSEVLPPAHGSGGRGSPS